MSVVGPAAPLRGQVFEYELPGVGRKPFVIVSNNQRNRALRDVLGARITTADKPALPTVIDLGRPDFPLVGRVLCDDVLPIPKDRLANAPMGALTPRTMSRVDDGLRVALAL